MDVCGVLLVTYQVIQAIISLLSSVAAKMVALSEMD